MCILTRLMSCLKIVIFKFKITIHLDNNQYIKTRLDIRHYTMLLARICLLLHLSTIFFNSTEIRNA